MKRFFLCFYITLTVIYFSAESFAQFTAGNYASSSSSNQGSVMEVSETDSWTKVSLSAGNIDYSSATPNIVWCQARLKVYSYYKKSLIVNAYISSATTPYNWIPAATSSGTEIYVGGTYLTRNVDLYFGFNDISPWGDFSSGDSFVVKWEYLLDGVEQTSSTVITSAYTLIQSAEPGATPTTTPANTLTPTLTPAQTNTPTFTRTPTATATPTPSTKRNPTIKKEQIEDCYVYNTGDEILGDLYIRGISSANIVNISPQYLYPLAPVNPKQGDIIRTASNEILIRQGTDWEYIYPVTVLASGLAQVSKVNNVRTINISDLSEGTFTDLASFYFIDGVSSAFEQIANEINAITAEAYIKDASNIGSGIGVYYTKDGNTLQFRSISPGSDKLEIYGSSDIVIDVSEEAIDHNKLKNYDYTEHYKANDAITTATNLWSAEKIATMFAVVTPTPTQTPSITPTITWTPTPTFTPTNTQTFTPTKTPTVAWTPTPNNTPISIVPHWKTFQGVNVTPGPMMIIPMPEAWNPGETQLFSHKYRMYPAVHYIEDATNQRLIIQPIEAVGWNVIPPGTQYLVNYIRSY